MAHVCTTCLQGGPTIADELTASQSTLAPIGLASSGRVLHEDGHDY